MMKKSVYLALVGAVSAQDLMFSGTAKMDYKETLPCSLCIRNGYTYKYKTASAGKPTRDLQNATDNYDGACLLRQFDGTYKKGLLTEDVTSAYHSDMYTDKKVALSDCPAKTTVCGSKLIKLDNKTMPFKAIETLSIESKTDSCHWLVKSQCDVPQITLDSTMSIKSSEWSIMTLEWSTDSDASFSADDGTGDYLPKTASSAWVPNSGTDYYPGTLPQIMYTDATSSKDVKFPAYLVLNDIADTKAAYLKYEEQLKTYNAAKKTWDDSTKALKDFYAAQDAKPEPGFFDFLAPAPIENPPKLASKPTVPVVPKEYTGIVGTDFKYFQGYGQLTSTWLKFKDSSDVFYPANKKYFGVFGQGTADGLGYDANKDTTVAGGLPQCSVRYFSINLMPEKIVESKVTSKIASVKSFDNTTPDLVKPTAPKAPVALTADPTRAEDSGKFLAVTSAAIMSLAALTLY